MSKKAKIILGIVLGVVGLFFLVVIGGWILTLSGIGGKGETEAFPTKGSTPAASSGLFETSDRGSAQPVGGEMPSSAADEKAVAGEQGELTQKKIIKTGNLNMTVESVDQTVANLTSMAGRAQGFVQSSYIYEGATGVKSGTIVLKVPVAKFDTIFQEVKGLAKVVTSEQVAGQDVTEEYIDLQARLKNAQAEEQQYLEIMKKATEVEDILKVTAVLSGVREKIERLQGQMRYLESMTDMSTITVEISEETKVVGGEVEKWKPYQTLKKASKALIVTLQKTVDRLIWIVIFLAGLFLPIGIIIWVIVKIVKRIRKKKANQNLPPQV